MAGSQSAMRALEVLKHFSRQPGPWSLRDLAVVTRLPKPTVFRLLQALVDSGFLERDGEKQTYSQGPELLRFVRQTLTQMDAERLMSLAHQPMSRLHETTKETVCLYRRLGHTRVLLTELESPQEMRIVLGVGRVRRLYQGAVGKVFLLSASDSELAAEAAAAKTEGVTDSLVALRRQVERARQDGVFVSRGESLPGSATIAAPIYKNGMVEGALVVTGPAARWKNVTYTKTAKLIATAARDLTAAWATSEAKSPAFA